MISCYQAMGLIWLGVLLSAASLQDAQRAYEEGDYKRADEIYEQLEGEGSDALRAYNHGIVQYHLKKYPDAVSRFQSAVLADDLKLRSKAFFNLGNAYVKLGDLKQAEKAYRDALSYGEDLKPAQENLAWVEAKLKEQSDSEANKDSKSDESVTEPAEDSGEKTGSETDKGGTEPGEDSGEDESKDVTEPGKDVTEPGEDLGEDSVTEPNEDSSEKTGGESGKDVTEPSEASGGKSGERGEDSVTEPDEDPGVKPGGESDEGVTEPGETPASKSGEDGSKDVTEPGEAEPHSSGVSQKQQVEVTQSQIQKQEAEKVIRSVEDKIGKYLFRPTKEQLERSENYGKDW